MAEYIKQEMSDHGRLRRTAGIYRMKPITTSMPGNCQQVGTSGVRTERRKCTACTYHSCRWTGLLYGTGIQREHRRCGNIQTHFGNSRRQRNRHIGRWRTKTKRAKHYGEWSKLPRQQRFDKGNRPALWIEACGVSRIHHSPYSPEERITLAWNIWTKITSCVWRTIWSWPDCARQAPLSSWNDWEKTPPTASQRKEKETEWFMWSEIINSHTNAQNTPTACSKANKENNKYARTFHFTGFYVYFAII